MKYSSALWPESENETLATAQLNSNRNIIDKALISPGDHVLDIGCGWGSLAIEAVRRTGCHITGITLSVEQKKLAEERIRSAGLEDSIETLLCDYRSVPRPVGGFDRVISVEMIEHVGREYMESFFGEISKLLKKDGGRVVIQGITLIESIHSAAPTVDTFIDRYIFPGGYLPTINTILTSLHGGSKASLEIEHASNIGPHYIKTLQSWHKNFLEHWESDIKPDLIKRRSSLPGRGKSLVSEEEIEAYRRTWLYYFSYCEAGFRARILGDHVVVAVRTPLLSIK